MHTEGPGFESALDFTLAPALDPQLLSELPEPALTVMLNRSEGTHDFTLFGAGGFKSRASFDVLEVQDLIRSARAGLRRAAWGDEDEWREAWSTSTGVTRSPTGCGATSSSWRSAAFASTPASPTASPRTGTRSR